MGPTTAPPLVAPPAPAPGSEGLGEGLLVEAAAPRKRRHAPTRGTSTPPPQTHPSRPSRPSPPAPTRRRPNFLFIVIDDLRWTGVTAQDPLNKADTELVGGQYAGTPNMARIRNGGLAFNRAHANSPWCGPSRASFLTGREPTATRVFNLVTRGFRVEAADLGAASWLTLPQLLKANGYDTYTAGKVFHPGTDDDASPADWTQVLLPNLVDQSYGYYTETCLTSDTYYLPSAAATPAPALSGSQAPTTSAAARLKLVSERMTFSRPGGVGPTSPDLLAGFACVARGSYELLDDFVVANATATKLLELGAEAEAAGGLLRRPFFMAAGFYRPHTPLQVHEDFLALFPDTLNARVPDAEFVRGPEPQSSMPKMFAIQPDSRQLRPITPVYHGVEPAVFRKAFRLAYAAAVAQTDAALGRVLDALDASPALARDTVIVLLGDNGFCLGDSSLWYKQLLVDHSTRVPLLLKMPGVAPFRTDGVEPTLLVELVDVYKTVADAAGLLQAVQPGVVGKSLLPWYLGDRGTAQYGEADVANSAVSIIPRCGVADRQCLTDVVKQLGFSIRTARWRYTCWVPTPANNAANWSSVVGASGASSASSASGASGASGAAAGKGAAFSPQPPCVGEELYDHFQQDPSASPKAASGTRFTESVGLDVSVEDHFNIIAEVPRNAMLQRLRDAFFNALRERYAPFGAR